MSDTHREKSARSANPEARRERRAFSNAMSAGLKSVYDPVTSHSVPDEFMELLERADKRSGSSF